jgi:MYXO-CTERM domain-containing protein
MRQVLAQPVGGEVFFAGEATHNSAPATVPGAIQTGERAAVEIDVALGGPPLPNAPSADFSPSATSGPAPLDVAFTDTSSQTPTSWNWDFGDTGSSVDQNPTHQYTVPGTYTVSLMATNLDGSHIRVKPNLIVVPEPGGGMQLVAGILGLAALGTRRRRRLGRVGCVLGNDRYVAFG